MDMEDSFSATLLTGLAISFPVAFGVLLLSTGSFRSASFAITTVGCIVVSVLGGARFYFQWDLGVAESISGVLVVGFSVDYTLHLGHMYMEANHLRSREDKTSFALTYMGGTILAGALTSLICAGSLSLGCLATFRKMASLFAFTVISSVMYSFFFFAPLCALWGPEGNIPSKEERLKSCFAFFTRKQTVNPKPSTLNPKP